jgi:hypothetical protein
MAQDPVIIAVRAAMNVGSRRWNDGEKRRGQVALKTSTTPDGSGATTGAMLAHG